MPLRFRGLTIKDSFLRNCERISTGLFINYSEMLNPLEEFYGGDQFLTFFSRSKRLGCLNSQLCKLFSTRCDR